MNHVIILTRKPEFIGNSASLLENMGFTVMQVPTIATTPWFDKDNDAATLKALSAYDDFVFVSRNAVENGLPLLDQFGGIPNNARIMAVGPETAKALSLSGYDALYPPHGNGGQALMMVDDLASMPDHQVLILRGVNGLDWLGNAMTERGATVKHLDCYVQNLPDASVQAMQDCMQSNRQIDSVFLHSVQSVANLLCLVLDDPVYKDALLQSQAIVGSQRIADYVIDKQWQGEVVIADSPSNQDMLLAHSRSLSSNR